MKLEIIRIVLDVIILCVFAYLIISAVYVKTDSFKQNINLTRANDKLTADLKESCVKFNQLVGITNDLSNITKGCLNEMKSKYNCSLDIPNLTIKEKEC